jgi:hypothetical protein
MVQVQVIPIEMGFRIQRMEEKMNNMDSTYGTALASTFSVKIRQNLGLGQVM